MANCMTCRHNDKKAKYCPVKKAHTDLGYVLNCIAWAPTDEAEMKRFRAENAKLRESLERAAGIIADICGECPVSRYEWLSSDGCAEKCGTATEEECWIAYLTGKRWDELGVEVTG